MENGIVYIYKSVLCTWGFITYATEIFIHENIKQFNRTFHAKNI